MDILCVFFFPPLPEVALVGGILDVVANVVVHSMSCCAVPCVEDLREGRKKTVPFQQ